MATYIPSPAISIVGRHNSGKTTLIEKLIVELVRRGYDVGSIKHHGHGDFDIDIPGKDSYRHRAAGATETVISAPGKVAGVRTMDGELECSAILKAMPGHDIVIVEGYRKRGLPSVEVMRAGNEADEQAAAAFSSDTNSPSTTLSFDVSPKLPDDLTKALVTDIPEAREAAERYGISVFAFEEIVLLADFLEENLVRPRLTVSIQAGGRSRRMGQSKATIPFKGHPLICRMVERLSPVADELIITTNEVERLGFLQERYPELEIRLVPDELEECGALPGLYTALKAAKNPCVAVVACDMVFASASLFALLALKMKETGADVVVPRHKQGKEPFHAVYRRETCLAAVVAALQRGEKRAQAFYDELAVYEFPRERVLEIEPMGGCFINVNTREELRRIEKQFL